MARKSSVEACLLCGAAPCECNAKPKRAVAKSRPVESPQAQPQPEVKSRSGAREAMKAAAVAASTRIAQPQPPAETAARTARIEAPKRSLGELIEEDCIRILGPILAESEREKYRMILTTRPSLADRKAVWKWRQQHEA